MMALRPKSAQAMAMRARIVLNYEQGMSNSAVAHKLQITDATVGKWRERYRQFGLDGLLDKLGKVERLSKRISRLGH